MNQYHQHSCVGSLPVAWVHWLCCYAVWFHSYWSGLDNANRRVMSKLVLWNCNKTSEIIIAHITSAGDQGDRPNHLPG